MGAWVGGAIETGYLGLPATLIAPSDVNSETIHDHQKGQKDHDRGRGAFVEGTLGAVGPKINLDR